MKLPFNDPDPAQLDFQSLEDLACAHWHSEALFAALELGLFDRLAEGHDRPEGLARAAGCRLPELLRLLRVLARLELVCCHQGRWANGPSAVRFLVSSAPDFMGDFLLYRRYMQPRWQGLAQKVATGSLPPPPEPADAAEYAARTLNYVRATDQLMRRKAPEIARRLRRQRWQGPVLDIGGGAGALARQLVGERPDTRAVLLELPEALAAARRLYADPDQWEAIEPVAGDFRAHPFAPGTRFGLVLLSNFLHAYSAAEARTLLEKAFALLQPGGLLAVHDYFPDRLGRSPVKGALYDLAMMLNTFNGACHPAETVAGWLEAAGASGVLGADLGTDSALVIAGRPPRQIVDDRGVRRWIDEAIGLGFRRAVPLGPDQVVTAPWVRLKCRFGCRGYGQNRQCPPETPDWAATREVLDAYRQALLVEGAPPGKAFHRRLLALEKAAFIGGFPKALVFGAGPCPICDSCPPAGPCRHPEQARPAMEAAGIDVYATAANAGIDLQPVPARDGYVKYLGLLLLE